jgi:DNA-binding XRE family transcriptional regulator
MGHGTTFEGGYPVALSVPTHSRRRPPSVARPLDQRPAVGLLLRSWRLAAGETQYSLAPKLGISQPFLAQCETGTKTPPPDRLADWARICGADLAELEALR